MSKTEILEKYFLKEIEGNEENKEVDMSGWWIVGKVKEATGNHMEVIRMYETDPEAWLENFKFILLENGYILSDRDCSAYRDDILEAMTEIYPEENLNTVINEKLQEILKDTNTWTLKPDYYTDINANPTWWNGPQITCTNAENYVLHGYSDACSVSSIADGTLTCSCSAGDTTTASATATSATATALDSTYANAATSYISSLRATC